jgi:DNA-binding response OmpR family regulator
MVHAVMAFVSQIAHLHLLHVQLPHLRLGAQEMLVLQILVEARGRVVSRTELRRRAGLCSDLRCDHLLVNVRRAVGPEVLQNVRGRGWRVERGLVPRG